MIGEVIKKKRKELGFTQSQLADMLQVTAPAVNKWENNLSFPDATLLSPLARCLKIDLNELFSFYNCLSDKERMIIIDKINTLLMNLKDEEAFAYIREVVCQNPSDGLLYKKIANTLHGFHIIKKSNQPTIYLEEISNLYEKALSLLPEDTIDIAYSLVIIYSELGNNKKAEEMWTLIPDNSINKKWIHIEMLHKLKEYDKVLYELKKYTLESIIELINNMAFLKENLLLSNNTYLAKIAEEKEDELIKLFNINPIIKAVNNMSAAFTTNDSQAQLDTISALLQIKKKKPLSSSPLFAETHLDSNEKYWSVSATINDLNNWDFSDNT